MKKSIFCKGLVAAVAMMMATPFAADAAKQKSYKVIDVANGATVSGKVLFDGAVPGDAIEKILITKDQTVCGEGDREVVWVDVKDGALRGSFVFLDKIKEGKAWAPPSGGFLIDQKDCRFQPWAQVVQPGQITIRNSDAGVLHNINTREMIGVDKGRVVKKGIFNFGQPDPGDLVQELKTRRGPYIGINCEAHNFMFGYMMAPVHPYAVVVGDDGSYSLDGIPAGKYTIKAWHPRYGIQKAKITVEAGGSLQQSFTFKN